MYHHFNNNYIIKQLITKISQNVFKNKIGLSSMEISFPAILISTEFFTNLAYFSFFISPFLGP